MTMQFYTKTEFTLDSTSGEAEKLFGAVPGMTTAPKLRIAIGSDAHVTFTVTGAEGEAGRDFSAEAEARYIDGNNFNSATWPDERNDMIIGHINWNQSGKQQLFLMWVREDPRDPTQLKLGFFFFANATRFSRCEGEMTIEGVGQQDGGGSGTGPK